MTTMLATLLCIALICDRVSSVAPRKRQSSNPDSAFASDPSQFYRRTLHSSIVVGDHLYIDGGEVYHLNNDDLPRSVPLNSTYSINLSSSWTNDSVALHRINKGSSPVLNNENLWPDESGSSFYAFNGIVSQAFTTDPVPPADNLWQFVPDGNSGTWTVVSAPNLKRLNNAASTSGNGSAYILGGWGSWRTSTDYYSDTSLRHPAGGIVSYDLNTREFTNRSIEEYAPTGWSYDAQLLYLDGLERGNLLLAMGGATAPARPIYLGEQTLNSFSYVSIFDTTTGSWFNQTTSGDLPAPRYDACSVGVVGDNGTFEIFLYGGAVVGSTTTYTSDQQANIDLADIYILSLPSFSWHQTTLNPKHSRTKHTCNVAGNRQMIVVGGVTANFADDNLQKDPWNQGLGVFDLTNLEWQSSYNPSADPYRTPGIVKDYISANGQYPTSWDSSTVAAFFTAKSVSTSPNSTSPDSSNSGSGGSGGSNTGAIAGGVVGGIGGLVLIALALFFYRRRKRRSIGHSISSSVDQVAPFAQAHNVSDTPKVDIESQSQPRELDSVRLHEMGSHSRDTRTMSEMGSSNEDQLNARHELP